MDEISSLNLLRLSKIKFALYRHPVELDVCELSLGFVELINMNTVALHKPLRLLNTEVGEKHSEYVSCGTIASGEEVKDSVRVLNIRDRIRFDSMFEVGKLDGC